MNVHLGFVCDVLAAAALKPKFSTSNRGGKEGERNAPTA